MAIVYAAPSHWIKVCPPPRSRVMLGPATEVTSESSMSITCAARITPRARRRSG
ncbi:hypothetical protein ACF1BU_00110 [Streptomyces sp. NPDC014724]|uniref:hypothetical protein n=1 Tax=unclassified Streptomyces TaxID=2593676 RepID=UPI003700F5DB